MKAKTNETRSKKAFAWIGFAVSLAIFAVALTIGISAVIAKTQGRPPEFFGHAFLIVQTDSMTPEIAVGEMVVVRICDVGEAAVGDNVVFTARSGAVKGYQIVHKAIDKEEGESGIELTTQGVKEGAPVDTDKVTADNFIGIAVGQSVFWGAIFGFLSQPLNWLLIIVLLVLIPFIIRQCIKIVKYVKDRNNTDNSDDTPQN